jgi:hypothetical protein
MDDEYFLASQWGLKDLHFETYNDQNDHPWHEYVGLEFTDEAATEKEDVNELLR